MTIRQKADKAFEKAVEFLANTRNSYRLWTDFRNIGGGEEYVTAYVGAILSGTGRPCVLELCREVWNFFGTRKLFDGQVGWARDPAITEDADSTAWGKKFARKPGLKDKYRRVAAEIFLRNHLTTAFTTSLTIEALTHTDCNENRIAVEKGLLWVMRKFSDKPLLSNVHYPSVSVYAKALAVRALAIAGKCRPFKGKLSEAVTWLLDPQKHGGSWPPSTTRLMPAPYVLES